MHYHPLEVTVENAKASLPKLRRRLLKAMGQAIEDFTLIEADDRVLVGLSGGKDSYTLLLLLLELQRKAPVRFELVAANLDPGYDTYQPEVVQAFAKEQGVEIHMLKAPIREMIETKLAPGDVACPLCARIRRGTLYTLAKKIGANKLALGHHLDDALETLLMNLFYSGSLRSMPPKLVRDEGPPTVIRPLCYAMERDIAAFSVALELPTIPCASPSCGSDEGRRQVIKGVLAQLESEHPDLKHQARKALCNVDPRFLFDRELLARITPSKEPA
ncbi:MAG: tRNA 2-thiocytidine(32) synthetase TtcA [Deltaproteobacteria bacterium]|nr:tRNA 2-thiocytidine(32) synthetase TtcA [Deltaproteobacteria bacterium]